jgi:hypothetical protein
VPVNPVITVESTGGNIVVKKAHTSPARVPVTLTTSLPFPRNGTLTRTVTATSGGIRFFDAATAGNEIDLTTTGKVFTGGELHKPVRVFAEADRASQTVNDFQLVLTLDAGAPGTPVPAGPALTINLTAVQLNLELFMSRTAAPPVDPAPLPPAPAAPAPGATPTDKWFGGRFLHVQDTGKHHGRALLTVEVKPAAVAGQLVLRQVKVATDVPGGLDNRIRLFDNETFTAGELAKGNPHQFAIPAAPLRLFAEAANVSAAQRDTGFQLGLKLTATKVENDGDRVRLTAVQFSHLIADVPSTAANTARPNPPGPASVLNSPVPRHTFDITNFAEDFALASTLVLVEDSIVPGDLINLSVRVAPAGVPVQWSVLRDTTAGTSDNAAIIALKPAAPGIPTLVPTALRATLLADHVGSFFIRPFIDCNGNNAFDQGIDKEPFIVMNLVLIRAQGVTNNSVANPPANATTLRAGTLFTTRTPAPATTAGFDLTTGNVAGAPGGNTFANPTVSAAHNDATILVIGGGSTGRRGLDRLMAGWIQSELPVATSPTVPPGEDDVAEYDDIKPPPPVRTHQRFTIWRAPGGPGIFLPGSAAPALLAGPFLDVSPRANPGTGGNTAVGTEGNVGPPVVPPGPGGPPPQPGITKTPVAAPGVGEQWRVHMWDSPGDIIPAAHGGFPGTLLRYRFNLDFRTDLCLWTNVTGVAGATANAANRLYSSVQTDTWTIRFSINVALTAPARPTLGTVAGGPLIARTYFVQVTYLTAAGETTASVERNLALTTGRRLRVASPPAAATATGYNAYAGTAAGTETLQNAAAIPIGTNFTEPVTGLVAGAAPPGVSTAGALAAPGAPGLGSVATAATTFFVQVSFVNARGETTASVPANLAVPAGRLLRVTSPAAFGDATGYNAYIGATAGTETLQSAAPIPIGTNFTMPATGLVAGTALPAANTTGGPITNVVALAPDPAPARQATPVQGSGLEVRGPIGLDVLAINART